jgi:hypothetical protein
MLYHQEDKNIYLVIALITAFFLFMFISGAISMHYISQNSSASLQEKRAN